MNVDIAIFDDQTQDPNASVRNAVHCLAWVQVETQPSVQNPKVPDLLIIASGGKQYRFTNPALVSIGHGRTVLRVFEARDSGSVGGVVERMIVIMVAGALGEALHD
jgi:hypothetical protein